MTPVPYLFFNGTCRDALNFYGQIFGTEPDLLTADGLPPEFDVPEDRKAWIMHGSLKVGNGLLMGSDNVMGTSDAMTGCAVQMDLPTAAEAKDLFEKLVDGGEVTMAFAPTFWSGGFGTLTDKFGIRWMVGTHEPPEVS
ncbi:MAG: VOC family protein [Pseudomonadota bacterium]